MSKQRFLACCIACAALLVSACDGGSPPTRVAMRKASLVHDGINRTYILHLPTSYDGSVPVPLLIAMHGYGGTAAGFERDMWLSSAADQKGFIVAYPNALGYPSITNNPQQWNAGGPCEQWTGGRDDVGFIAALIDQISLDYSVDSTRIYAAGHSNGSMMSYRVAAELSDRIAAIVPMSGQMFFEPGTGPIQPFSIIHFHAKDDAVVPYAGGFLDSYASSPPTDTVLSYWARRFACETDPTTLSSTDVLTVKEWKCPDSGPTIKLYLSAHGGHSYPSESALGAPPIEVIWGFLDTHAKR
jgi:polyhydroxybutyrate depolymerase